jgi:hypothetical protein
MRADHPTPTPERSLNRLQSPGGRGKSPGDDLLDVRSGEPVQYLPETGDRRRNRQCQTITGQCTNGRIPNPTRLLSGVFQPSTREQP